ncbi:MAG TPA: hypothetical protein VLG37_02580 [Candidatus Saccharimonadales bacterium]|nr:hypothetical protein [Candidatus Saccharimonadales bacterium]
MGKKERIEAASASDVATLVRLIDISTGRPSQGRRTWRHDGLPFTHSFNFLLDDPGLKRGKAREVLTKIFGQVYTLPFGLRLQYPLAGVEVPVKKGLLSEESLPVIVSLKGEDPGLIADEQEFCTLAIATAVYNTAQGIGDPTVQRLIGALQGQK